MEHYCDLKTRKVPEIPTHQILEEVYRRLHLALVSLSMCSLGVSFPEHTKKSLGSILRLHGTDNELKKLMDCNWLAPVHDYLEIGDIASVPKICKYRVVRRKQVKSNPERLARRAAKRHGLSYEVAKQKFPDSTRETCDLPFLMIRSSSTGQKFPLLIEHGDVSDNPKSGSFNTYGFSRSATVPWF